MTDRELLEELEREYGADFSGWDFSRLCGSGRMQESVLPWNYPSIARRYAAGRSCLLDMGTGGGEFLDSLDFLPPRAYATEGYAPNVPIAAARLAPKGIEVRAIGSDEALPFPDAFFDLVLNRHEAFSVPELARVMAGGGVFLTQQVGALNALDLTLGLGGVPAESMESNILASRIEALEAAGFEILECDEAAGSYRFFDSGAIAYYLRCVPWQLPGFSPAACLPRLRLFQRAIERRGWIDFISHRYYLAARAP